MDTFTGQLADRSALDVFRQLGIERRTGVLDLMSGGAERSDRFFFVSGELYLAPDHPFAQALGAGGEGAVSGSSAALRDGEGVGESWFADFVARLDGWASGTFRFAEDLSAIPSDLVGPLPTFSIIMTGAVAGLEEFDLLRRLGGEDARFIATPGRQAPPPELLRLDTHEAFFLSRLEQVSSVKDLLGQSDLDRAAALCKLCRLLAAGLLCRESELPDSHVVSLLTGQLLEKFSARIERSLQREPVAEPPDDHRRRIADLLGRLGGMTHYELLGIGSSATSEEVHDAYTQLARVVHPHNAPALGLGGREAGMQLLFERATEAYLTLSDRERSRRYLQKVGTAGEIRGQQSSESRRGEVERLAEENYRRARSFFAREDYHFAVELLQQAVRIDPRAEYYTLLGRCQAQNPSWLPKAISSFGRALQLDGGNVSVRLELARALEAAGDTVRARREYSEVLRLDSNNREASSGLARMSGGKTGKAVTGSGGLVNRILERLRPGEKK